MGEIIKNLASVRLQDGIDLQIELNSSVSGKGGEIVHIQASNFRAEFFKSDFIESATAILVAADHLKKIKNIEENE
jgi:hypothetical protein